MLSVTSSRVKKGKINMHENNMQLPYDKCVKIDQEIDSLLEEEKKRQQLTERKAKLLTDSKKSRHLAIYEWLGWDFILEYLSGCALFAITFIPLFFILLVLTVAVQSGYIREDFVIKCINVTKHIMPSPQKYIKKKMLKKNYLIPEDVIDCPIAVKQELYSLLDERNKYYIALRDSNIFLYDKNFDCASIVTEIDKDSETQYLINQFVEGEYYSITDIITDNQVKYEGGN